jgi:hypothetical protein
MPKLSPAMAFEKYLSQLLSKRSEYVNGLQEIDGLFSKWGIKVEPPNGRGRKPGRPKMSQISTVMVAPAAGNGRKRRKRGRFSHTADEFILSLLQGDKKLETKDINAAWKAAGRGGRADQPLAKMVKDGKLKRMKVKGERGSRYVVV